MPSDAWTAPGFERGSLQILSLRDRLGSAGLTGMVFVLAVAALLLLPATGLLERAPVEKLTTVELPPPVEPEPEPVVPEPPRVPSLEPTSPPETPSAPRVFAIAASAPILPPIELSPPEPVPAGEGSSGRGSAGDGDARSAGAGGDGTGGNGAGGNGSGGGGDGSGSGGEDFLRTGQWRQAPSARDFNPPPNMRRGAPREGWGQIICVSARGDRLENCATYAEYPAGSGFSEAMREVSRRFRYMVRDDAGEPVIGQRVLVHLNFLPPNGR